MRIDANKVVTDQLITERSTRNSGKQNQASSDASSGSVASFSADTAGIQALEARVLATPEVRQERVVALRDAIQNGSYDLDPKLTAEAMLKEAGR